MAITTTLQTKFTLQKIFVVLVCLVMGLWGVYDHEVKIPNKARAYERGQVCLKTKNALEADPASPATGAKLVEARDAVETQLKKLADLGQPAPATSEEAKKAIESIAATSGEQMLEVLVVDHWPNAVDVFQRGLAEARTRTASTTPSQGFALAYEAAKVGVNLTADVTPPGRFDQATQWMFILCLPFVPYFAWSFFRARRRVYRLDDDGTLHAPEGSWSKNEIADIDMKRWMSKSTAVVHTKNGAEVKLDDYVYRNTHLIVGALASERYPDEWDEEARSKKKAEAEAAAAAAANEPEPEAGDPAETATEETPAEV